MKVVIDTNILLVSLPRRSRYRPIFDAYINSTISIIITTDIYFEYLEVLYNQAKEGIAEYIKDSLGAAENVIVTELYYYWNLITVDPDDNKFTDAYIAANADYLVTNDAHFNEVKKTPFPPINVVSADDFLEVLERL